LFSEGLKAQRAPSAFPTFVTPQRDGRITHIRFFSRGWVVVDNPTVAVQVEIPFFPRSSSLSSSTKPPGSRSSACSVPRTRDSRPWSLLIFFSPRFYPRSFFPLDGFSSSSLVPSFGRRPPPPQFFQKAVCARCSSFFSRTPVHPPSSPRCRSLQPHPPEWDFFLPAFPSKGGPTILAMVPFPSPSFATRGVDPSPPTLPFSAGCAASLFLFGHAFSPVPGVVISPRWLDPNSTLYPTPPPPHPSA